MVNFSSYDRFVHLKVGIDEGITGWGEAAFHDGQLTAQIAETLGQKVLGRDPFHTNALWQQLFRGK
ncbi:hypothetical protein CMK14_21495 [Candidatus Poribacteria bacterium]|nr:hypothetical protein [Candidatus Poribacteria bacterium]